MEGNYYIRDQDSGLWHHFFNYAEKVVKMQIQQNG